MNSNKYKNNLEGQGTFLLLNVSYTKHRHEADARNGTGYWLYDSNMQYEVTCVIICREFPTLKINVTALNKQIENIC